MEIPIEGSLFCGRVFYVDCEILGNRKKDFGLTRFIRSSKSYFNLDRYNITEYRIFRPSLTIVILNLNKGFGIMYPLIVKTIFIKDNLIE